MWHWLIKNLMGTRRRNDVDATSLRRIDAISTSCACWEFGPPLAPQNSKPWPPQYSKPSYAYDLIESVSEGFPSYFWIIWYISDAKDTHTHEGQVKLLGFG